MNIDNFLHGCLNSAVIFIISMITFYMGFSNGEKSMQKEAIQKDFGRYDLNTNNQIVFKWNDKI